ncbi:MAG: 2-oxoacid:acceptor oxidoreductase family protein [Chloroflexota bacterium]|nr:MAG: 2-oxoacid:acceptor oxidoreductase family protein [Chloroflexota bacterium]
MTTKLYEIRWHGRGGQGAVTAAKILAQAAHFKGYQGVTAAPSFGAERRGVPVSALTRVSTEAIAIVSQVEKPEAVVVLDQSLLKYQDVISGLDMGGWLVVNSWLHPKELNIKGDFNIATADATKVCRELGLMVGGLPMVNTAMLGAIARATQIVDMPNIEKVIRERFSNSAVEVNLTAIEKTYEITKLERIS